MTLQGGFIAPGLYQNLTETDRQLLKYVAGNVAGVDGNDDFKVITQSGMTIQATLGRAFVAGLNTTAQGYYMVYTVTNELIPIPAAHATLARIDRVVLAMRDPQYGAIPGGTDPGPAIVVVAGTPAGSPVVVSDGTVTTAVGPGGWLELARVTVPAAASSISAGNISDTRVHAWSKRAPEMQVFTSTGTYTKPQGARKVRVRCVGGGGAGGGAMATTTNQGSVGGGGGGGGYSESMIDAATLAATVAVTVGDGGTAVSGGAGNTGGTSSFGSHLSATGGAGGAFRGAHAFANWLVAGGGAGGVGSSGQINSQGGPGSIGFVTTDITVKGGGGNCPLGGGYPPVTTSATDVVDNGEVGFLYGGGGSGGANKQAHSARVGGVGAKGVVIVETFF